MKVKALLGALSFLLLFASFCFSQDPLPVIRSGWQPAIQKAAKVEVPQTGPAKQIISDDTLGPRSAREFSTDHPENPSDRTPDGRRAMIERNEQEAKTVQPQAINGFTYTARVRNDSSKTVKVVYWEYKFTERANPSHVVRRQFLCSADLKKGAEADLTAFSTLAPSETVDAKALAVSPNALFDEAVRVNRIEYADDDILQRGDWKYADVKADVERVTAKPWGKEICRPL